MKQFQLLRANGDVRGPYEEGIALHFQTGYDDRQTLSALEVGFSMRDGDGDLWTRLDDKPETGPVDPAEIGRQRLQQIPQAERLERIATAAMVPGITAAMQSPEMTAELLAVAGKNGTTLPAMVAVDAVAFAKALIAELDKQA